MVVSYLDVKPWHRERAEQLDIELVAGNQLRSLGSTIQALHCCIFQVAYRCCPLVSAMPYIATRPNMMALTGATYGGGKLLDMDVGGQRAHLMNEGLVRSRVCFEALPLLAGRHNHERRDR